MAFNNNNTTQVGTKGSDVYTVNGVDDPRVALSVLLVQGCDPSNITTGIDTILLSNDKQMLEDLFVLLFQTRDIRGGKGVRDATVTMVKHLLQNETTRRLMLDLLDLIPEYGSWRDLKMLILDSKNKWAEYSTDLENRILDLFCDQLTKDSPVTASPSLAAKYAPRECHDSRKEKELAKQLALRMFPGDSHSVKISQRLASYRKMVSRINKEIDTTEIKMCGAQYAEIDPAKVPGRALQKYTKAFLNQPSTHKTREHPRPSTNPDRVVAAQHFAEHFAKAAKGEVKVNGSTTVFPHEIIKKVVHNMSRHYFDNGDVNIQSSMTQEEQDMLVGVWNQMVKDARAGGGLGRSLAMCDFSGSMQSSGSNGDTPYWVSMALGLLISEVTTKEFEDVFLSFDSTPQFHHLPKGNIFQRVGSIHPSLGQGMSTDFQKAMDLVLQRCKQQRVRPGEEPENLIVLTDMNWDQACASDQRSYYTGSVYRSVLKTDGWQTHMEMIRESFRRAGEDMWGTEADGGLGGLKMPRIVIWNIAATSTDFHAKMDTEGVVMLSGWSPSLFKVLQNDGVVIQTPYQALRAQLDDERYNAIRERVRNWSTIH